KALWEPARDASVPFAALQQAEREQEASAAYLPARDHLYAADVLDRVGAAMEATGYAGDLGPPKLAYVAMTSRLLERPVNLVFVAPSAAGKNRAVDAAAALIPPEALHIEKAGSARALVYSDEDYEHRVIIVNEADSI